MDNILEFINNNAIVASIITFFITLITQIIFRKSDRKYNEKNEGKKEGKQQFLDKAELYIEDLKQKMEEKPDICLFMTKFTVTVTNTKEVLFNYRSDILTKEKYKHLRFYLKNIENSDIKQLDICVTNQKNIMLCDIELIKTIVKNKFVNYNYCYDRKILKNDIILIDIAYLEDDRIFNVLSSELLLLFKDSYDNLYGQPFFIQQRKLYEPYRVSSKEYKMYILPDIALECFRNP